MKKNQTQNLETEKTGERTEMKAFCRNTPIPSFFYESAKSDFTYVNDEEVEPAPGVGEILGEAVGHPLQQHLQDENVGEDLVRIFQDRLDVSPLLDVDVLESLRSKELNSQKKTHSVNCAILEHVLQK